MGNYFTSHTLIIIQNINTVIKYIITQCKVNHNYVAIFKPVHVPLHIIYQVAYVATPYTLEITCAMLNTLWNPKISVAAT